MMEVGKKTYYIAVGAGEISQSKSDSAWNFKIEATDEEITKLRSYFNDNYSHEWQSFVRSHIPFVEYHHDSANDAYDTTMKKIYECIYELGDDDARCFIGNMGVLGEEYK